MISSEFFIRRPRFAGVISCVLVLLGLMAIVVLPVSQYPDIVPPQIVVSATYPGASANVVQDTVAVPIENQLNGVEGMMYMSSTSNDNGTYKLTITFDTGTNADIAQVKVQNRLQQITAFLPDIVIQEGITVETQTANILGMLVLYSPDHSYDNLELSNYAYTHILNPLKRVDGISTATVYGAQASVRIWMNPVKIASLNLTADDVIKSIQSQNTQAAVGSIGSAPSDEKDGVVLTLSAKGLLKTTDDFENIIISTDNSGGIIRLRDIARIEMGADTYDIQSFFNNQPAVIIGLSQTPHANSLQVMKRVQALMNDMQKTFPQGMKFDVAYDSTDFVRASINGILMTLVITFLLVVGVVFLFLQNARATLIPMITIPVSLVATFAVIYIFGFDINILTLFAMILAIGLVVDDAIIVVERVQYLMQYYHMSAISASIQAMKDIGSAIIATTLVLLAIFVPVGLMAGITGKIYQQFAVTIATAVFFSAINALTLSPALCAIFFEKKQTKQIFPKLFKPFNVFLEKSKEVYGNIVHYFIVHLKTTLLLISFVIGCIGFLFFKIPTSFIPQEDEGVIFANVSLKETSGINQTTNTLYDMGKTVLSMDGVKYFIGITGASLLGSGGENIGMGVVGLDNWDKRQNKNLSLDYILRDLQQKLGQNPIADVNFFALPSIPGVGNSNGLTFQLNAINPKIDSEQLERTIVDFLIKMNKMPDFLGAFSTLGSLAPHLFLEVNRTKLESLNVPVSSFFSALQNNLGSRYVNDITLDGQVNKVIVQADFDYRKSRQNVEDLHVFSTASQMVQVQNFADLSIQMLPKIIYRFNTYLSAGITAQTAQDISTGQAIKTLQGMVKTLGNDFSLSWTGLSLQEVETSGLAFILMGLSFIFGYLFLVALYESWLIAFSVIFSNIFAVMGALIGLMILDLPLSIYAQLGIVLLIGLASKNAILIVEFILDAQKKGKNVLQAAISGATERFRAVLMTALTFILGVMPMVFDTGAGAASQNSMGTAVFFGMIFATIVGILFIPALFVIFFDIGHKKEYSINKKVK
ncbi:MAG: efflux RND transporter permease subunit [Alphaproteobacteria bacterium]|nr:efflux RND transporter permease subunit [Alphaproteobacteria bacterium]